MKVLRRHHFLSKKSAFPWVILLTVFALCNALPSAFGIFKDPTNDPDYFQILESHRDSVRVLFEIAEGESIPNESRFTIALPSSDYELTVEDYSYRSARQKNAQTIKKDQPEDKISSEAIKNFALKQRICHWHDLSILLASVKPNMNNHQNSGVGPVEITRLVLRYDFPKTASASEYQFKKTGGFSDIFATSVLNPKSVPDFRRRPVLTGSSKKGIPLYLGGESKDRRAVRIRVREEGLYGIPYDQLRKTYPGISSWNPEKVNLWYEGQTVPISLQGLDESGRWTEDSQILFWGLESKYDMDPTRVYFLAESTEPAHRVEIPKTKIELPSRMPAVAEAAIEVVTEPQKMIIDEKGSHLQGEWFWHQFSKEDPAFTLTMQGLAPPAAGATISLEVRLNSAVYQDASMQIRLADGRILEEFNLPRRSSLNQEVHFTTEQLQSATGEIVLEIIDPEVALSRGEVYLKSLRWRFKTPLRAAAEPLILNRSLFENKEQNLLFEAPPGSVFCWGRNIKGSRTVDLTPFLIEQSNGVMLLPLGKIALDKEINYLLWTATAGTLHPVSLERTKDPDILDSTQAVDAIYLAHPEFSEAIEPLAEWRRREGFRVRIIDSHSVYDRFSHGHFSAEAFRDFFIYVFQHWPDPLPEYVTLVGDSSYDPKDNLKQGLKNFLPYATYNNRSPINEPADEWFVRFYGSDELSDMIIGRISINSVEDARGVVRKIIRQENHPLFGPWRNRTLICSDNHFEDRCRKIMEDTVPPSFESNRMELRNYPMSTNFSFRSRGKKEKKALPAKQIFISRWNQGLASAAYFGHGGGSVMAHEGLFVAVKREKANDAMSLDNGRRMPFLTILSCLTGLINYPKLPYTYCLSEEIYRQPDRGAIAVYGPSGYGGAHDHEILTRHINRALIEQNFDRIGQMVAWTEAHYFFQRGRAGINEQYNLFGDPLTLTSSPTSEGNLRCIPDGFTRGEGSIIEIQADSLPFSRGHGLVQIYEEKTAQPLKVLPVAVEEHSMDLKIAWSPLRPAGTYRVTGYFWNAEEKKQTALSAFFHSEESEIHSKTPRLSWAPEGRRLQMEWPLSCAGAASGGNVQAVVQNKNGETLVQKQISIPVGKEVVEKFVIPAAQIQDTTGIELSLFAAAKDPLSFEKPAALKKYRYTFAVDSATGTSEKIPAVLDLTNWPAFADSKNSQIQFNAPVYLPRQKNWKEASLEVSGSSATVSIQLNSSQQWHSALLIFDVTGEPADATTSLKLNLLAGDTKKEAYAWTVPTPRLPKADLAIRAIEADSRYVVTGKSEFFLAEFQNQSNVAIAPGHFELKSRENKKFSDVFQNSFNIKPPQLPQKLAPGEIVRNIYRWDTYDNHGTFEMHGRLTAGQKIFDPTPENNEISWKHEVLPLRSFIWGQNVLGGIRGARKEEEIRDIYEDYLRQVEWYQAFNYYKDKDSDLLNLRRSSILAMAAGDEQLSEKFAEIAVFLEPDHPDSGYLEAMKFFRQNKMEQGSKILKRLLEENYFDSQNGLVVELVRDVRYDRALYLAEGPAWASAMDLFYLILEQQPCHLPALSELTALYRRLGRYGMAVETAMQTGRLVDFDIEALPADWFRQVVRIYGDMNQPAKMEDVLNKAKNAYPEGNFILTEAYVKILQGKTESARLTLMNLSSDESKQKTEVFRLYLLGRCREAEGRREEAIKNYRAALVLDPFDRPSRERLLKLRTKLS